MAEQTVTIVAQLKDQFTGRIDSIRGGLSKLRTDFSRLGQTVSPIFNRLSLAVAGFASVQGFRAALEAAEKQVQAEKAVSFALRGREQQLENVLQLTRDIQAASTVGDEDLLRLSSRFLAVGVSTADLPRNLQASVDTAAALGIEVDQVGRAIQQFSLGRAGELGERIPFLKQLQADGKLAEEGIQALLDAFGGAALAEAETSFGRIDQRLNQLGDTSERIGTVLVDVKAGFLDAALPAAERFADFLEGPEVRNGLKLLASFAPVLISIAAAATAFGAALSAIKLVLIFGESATILFSILGTVGAIVANVLLIGAPIAGAVVLLLDAFGVLDDIFVLFDDIVDSVSDFTSNFRDVLSLFFEGKLTVEDLQNALGRLFAKIAIQIDAFVLNPIKQVFFFTIDAINGVIDLISNGAKFAVLGLVDLTQTQFLNVVRFIAGLVDGLLDNIASAIEKIPGIGADVAKSIRTNLASAIPDRFIDIGDDVDKAAKDSAAALQSIKDSFNGALSDIQAGITEAGEQVADIDKEGAQAIADRLFQVAQDEAKAADEAVETEKKKNARILAEAQRTFDELDKLRSLDKALITADDLIDISPSQIRDLLEGLNSQAQEPVRQLLIGEIEDQLKREEISLNQFLELRREIEVGLLEETLKKQQEKVDVQRQLVAGIQQERDKVQELVDAGDNSLENNKQLVELNGSLNDEASRLLRLEQERQKTILDIIAAEREQRDVKIGLGDAIVQEVEDAREKLADRQAEIADQLNSGTLFPTEAVSQSDMAVAQFTATLEAAKLKLAELAASAPESADEFDMFREKIDDIGASVGKDGVSTDIGDFFTGISDGAKQASAQFNDLKATGVGVGQELVTSFSEGLIDVFVKGSQSFEEFLGKFLQGIAVMLARIAVLKAVSAAFGFFANDGGEVPSQGLNAGGEAIGFDSGGHVGGPPVNRDIIPAKLTPGEWVIRKAAASGYYGRRIMSAINNMLIPREVLAPYAGKGRGFANLKQMFADGGEAAGAAMASAGGGPLAQQSYVFSDEQSLERQLNGGEASFFRMLDRHAGRVKSTLDRRPV